MKIGSVVLVGAPLMLLASPCLAQAKAAAPKDAVDDYLCTFAGKCGAATGEAESVPTIAAPATKGFRLATPQAAGAAPQQSVAAPTTKGFRLATTQPTVPVAHNVRPVPTKAAPVRVAARSMPAAHVAAAAAPIAVAPAQPRANLRLAFEYNSDRLTPEAQARARSFAQALTTPELMDKRFLIEGHTDSRGSHDLNVDLSRRRAQAVADFLAQHGVEASRVEVKGVGPDEPLAGQAATAEANRRVEAVLLS